MLGVSALHAIPCIYSYCSPASEVGLYMLWVQCVCVWGGGGGGGICFIVKGGGGGVVLV